MKLDRLNPIVTFIYFSSVLIIAMFMMNPFLQTLALIGGVLYFIKINSSSLKGEIGFAVIFFLLVSLTNPMFSHKGATVLFFINQNPITLESFLYGIGLGIMFVAVIFWFKCFNRVITDEKLVYIFGSISPKLALVVSSSLRFIPLLKQRIESVKKAQKAMGMYSSEAWIDKIRNTLRTYSSVIGWAIENAVDTGASMKGRGYGLKPRTRYSVFSFKSGDVLSLLIILALDAIIVCVIAFERLDFSYYPTVVFDYNDHFTIIGVIAYGLLSLFPFILEIKEDLLWKYYRSTI